MDRTTTVIGGVIVIALIAGLVFYFGISPGSSSNNNTATTTPTGSIEQGTDNSQKVIALPLVITNSTAAPSNTAAVVNGWVTPNGAFTNYWYEYGTSATLGSKTPSQMVGSGYVAIATPAFIEGLAKDTTYHFRLVAQNNVGSVSGTIYSFKTSSLSAPPVGGIPAVKTLSASNVSRTGATLKGEVHPNQAVTQYWFEYGVTSNLGNTTAFTSAGSGTSSVDASVALANLTPLTTYYFRMNVQNQFGTVNGAILNFKTLGPVAQAMPTVTTSNASAIGTSTAMLHGTIDPKGLEMTYWFEYSTNSSFVSTPLGATPHLSFGAGTAPQSISATIVGLSRSTTYYVRLVAQNNLTVVRGDRVSFKTK